MYISHVARPAVHGSLHCTTASASPPPASVEATLAIAMISVNLHSKQRPSLDIGVVTDAREMWNLWKFRACFVPGTGKKTPGQVDSETTESAADSTAAAPEPTPPRGLDSEEAALCELPAQYDQTQ